MSCTPHEETSATGSPAAARSDLAGSAATQAEEQGKVLRSGVFAAGEHSTSGTARLVERDGATTLELDEAFTTSTAGPDLVVALHRSGDVIGSTTPPAFPIKEGEYVVLAPLESHSGAQSYAVPAEIQTEDFASAVIWCRRFNATFGAARLDPQP
ncbi:MAG: DM13 domain-containing protein [Synechococcaceae cyanobacterium]